MSEEIQKVKAFLEGNKGGWSQIAREIGVTPQWVSGFMSGKIKEAGFDKITKLLELTKDEQ